MKKLLFILSVLMLVSVSAFGQSKLKTKSGTINFEASVPSFEEVKAINKDVSAILNTETGEFAALALMKGFRFKIALMEEHFNENYVESSKFPKAVFKGTIVNFNKDAVSDTPTEFKINGSITLHGVTRDIHVPVKIWREDQFTVLSTDFKLKPTDFDIKIPAIVSKKVAEEVEVNANFSLSN